MSKEEINSPAKGKKSAAPSDTQSASDELSSMTELEVVEYLFTSDEGTVKAIIKSDDSGVAAARDRVLINLNSAVEAGKPKLRQKMNKFKNSTMGTLVEVGLGTLVVAGATYLAGSKGSAALKKRKAKKLEAASI